MSQVNSSDGQDERVASPGPGSYDPEAVAASARRADPGLPIDVAVELAGQAGEALRAGTDADGPTLARSLLADNPKAGATACNVVATAAAEFVTTYDVPLD